MSPRRSSAIKLTKRTVRFRSTIRRQICRLGPRIEGFRRSDRASGDQDLSRPLSSQRPKRRCPQAICNHWSAWATNATDSARDQAKIILGKVAQGEDPAADVELSKSAMTLGEIARSFLEQHVAAKRKPRTEEHYRYIIETLVLPRLKSRTAENIKRADFSQLHFELRETPHNANRMLAVVSSLYSYAASNGLVPERCNPIRGIEKYREQGRERYLTEEELKRLGDAIMVAETTGIPWTIDANRPTAKFAPNKPENQVVRIDLYAAAAIRLLLLTGCRKSEILSLEWKHVDLERGLLHLPDSKTGKKVVVLSRAAIELLRTIPHKTHRLGNRVSHNQYVIARQLAGSTPI